MARKKWRLNWALEQIRKFLDTIGYVWTAENDSNTLRVDAKIFASAKKYLRKKKFPDTCGHGLKLWNSAPTPQMEKSTNNHLGKEEKHTIFRVFIINCVRKFSSGSCRWVNDKRWFHLWFVTQCSVHNFKERSFFFSFACPTPAGLVFLLLIFLSQRFRFRDRSFITSRWGVGGVQKKTRTRQHYFVTYIIWGNFGWKLNSSLFSLDILSLDVVQVR